MSSWCYSVLPVFHETARICINRWPERWPVPRQEFWWEKSELCNAWSGEDRRLVASLWESLGAYRRVVVRWWWGGCIPPRYLFHRYKEASHPSYVSHHQKLIRISRNHSETRGHINNPTYERWVRFQYLWALPTAYISTKISIRQTVLKNISQARRICWIQSNYIQHSRHQY